MDSNLDSLQTISEKPVTAALPGRSAVRSIHQALVVVERRMAREGDPRGEGMPPGWNWVLGNAKIADLFDQLFAESELTWSSLVVPEEQQATFAALSPPSVARQKIVSYDGQLQIHADSLTAAPDSGPSEPLFLIFNGHRFPICDLNHAILVHRQNRCDATLIDFPQIKRGKSYDENLRIDQSGQVQRVDRSYENGTNGRSLQVDRDWPVIIVLSSAAMQHAARCRLPHRINQWPGADAPRGAPAPRQHHPRPQLQPARPRTSVSSSTKPFSA